MIISDLSAYPHTELETINDELDLALQPGWTTESWLSDCCTRIEAIRRPADTVYWLLMARLTEAALLAAGSYADNAEFAAAGDLLVNPRRINVYLNGSRRPIVKNRHGRLSDQFNTADLPYGAFIREFPRQAAIEQTDPPLIPHLISQLEASGFVSAAYLDTCRQRMNRIADTMNFLMTWGICSFEALAARRAAGDMATLKFIEQHLCRFDTRRFVQIGEEIRRHIYLDDLSGSILRIL